MAGVPRLGLPRVHLHFIVIIVVVSKILIIVAAVEEKTVPPFSKEDFPNPNVQKDVDGEVDIEDVEEINNDWSRSRYVSFSKLKEDNANDSVFNNRNSKFSRDTSLATVYEYPVENFVHDDDKTKAKPARTKVACLGAILEPDFLLSEEDNSTAFDDEHMMNSSLDFTETLTIVNATVLLHEVLYINPSIKTRANPSNCSVILFYARWCPFSAKAAPHFNALPRAFPSVRIAAVDSSLNPTVNTYFGILSVPTVILFHNGKIIAKFNDTSFTLNKFADFIHAFSDLKSVEKINVTSQDFHGPLLSKPIKEIDYYLYLAWIFIIMCFIHYVSKSTLWKKATELVRTAWREAEAHHEHDD